jgi:UDP-N-acetylglucosamine--N-acetylmuramyl-(pentapeptide) pyrophosphoryl-undecaprenol N-acetylglucosamine transferase
MRLLFAGGGTGGHIYPAVSIAKAVKARYPEAEILFVGAERGMETDLVPREGFRLETIRVVGLARRNPVAALRSLVLAAQGLIRGRRIVREFQPDVAVGTGGYVSGPAILAAALGSVPVLIHEQNAFPGLTTRALSRYATVVAVNFPEAIDRLPRARRTAVTGQPIRPDFYRVEREAARRLLQIPADAEVIMSVGGSGGALRINQAVLQAAEQLLAQENRLLLQITGRRDYEQVKARAEQLALSPAVRLRWRIIPFMYEMPEALGAADLVISRAGASTLEEVAAVGVPALIIPSPNVTDNHQEHNANSLARRGAAVVIRDSLLDHRTLLENVNAILGDAAKRAAMAAASRQAGHPRATEDLLDLILELAGSNA